ncbi:kinase-like domain-containing protein [Suillus placidus]|uniref:non-specific serine/threonine protein kinase n=1 Tax=Suillus placidus TaxID=48579 RepID=A0A9P6ZKM5_9AGAM|nr:kinase-like domain-containing protein [Suillus placidus]
MGLEMSFQTRDRICFAMELMASDLYTYMTYRPAYCFDHARRWTAQIALGINALHEIGILHRDIKAENILIDVRENARIADFGLSYVNKDEGPLKRQQGYTAGAVGTIHCMAPEILHSRSNPGSMKYGVPVDWWALGCVIYELVSRNHEARFASSFAAMLLISSCQALFVTEDDILSYVSWCSSGDRTSKQFPIFENFSENIADLISGLLEPVPSSRYGFREVTDHKSFLLASGTSEFSDAYSRGGLHLICLRTLCLKPIAALEREELPDSLPDLQYGRETLWFTLPSWEEPRVPNVDWIKPTLLSYFTYDALRLLR